MKRVYKVIDDYAPNEVWVCFGEEGQEAIVKWQTLDHQAKMEIDRQSWPLLIPIIPVLVQMSQCNGEAISPNEFMAILNDLGYERVSHCIECGELFRYSKWDKGSPMRDFCTVHCWSDFVDEEKRKVTCPECGDEFQGADGELCSCACAGAHDEYEQYIEETNDNGPN